MPSGDVLGSEADGATAGGTGGSSMILRSKAQAAAVTTVDAEWLLGKMELVSTIRDALQQQIQVFT